MLDSFTKWMEQHFVPVAAKIGSQRHLVAIRDGFISMMPLTMAGATAVLLNVFLRDLPTEWGWTGFVEAVTPIIAVNGNVWWGTLAMLALALSFALPYNLAKGYDVNPLAGGLVGFGAFIVTIPSMYEGAGWGYLSWQYTNGAGLFTALLVGLVAGEIYCQLMKKNITIKLPASVPPAVSKAFASIIPGTAAIYAIALIVYLVNTYVTLDGVSGLAINDIISQLIQKPLLELSQGYFAVFLVTLLVQVFWFFGLHGPNVLAPILESLWGVALVENINAFAEGARAADLPYMWTRGSFDAYVWMGGSGGTIVLLASIFLFSKKPGARAVAKISTPPGLFNINEPVLFGLPIVLNPIYFIPFLVAPVVMVTIAYAATAAGIVPPVAVAVPWVMPPVFMAILSTGGSITAGLLAIVNLVVGFLIWTPFVIAANNMQGE
jgi:PTS system cellobiose-specific IIC component